MARKLIIIASIFIFAGIVLAAIPAKEVKIIPVTVSPVNNKPIKEFDDVVFRLYKGNYVPVKFEDAYNKQRDREARELAEQFKKK